MVEDLYLESLGISEQVLDASGQFHCWFPKIFLGPDYMRPERTLTGMTQTGTMKFT